MNHAPRGQDLPRTQLSEATGANFSENRRDGRLLGTIFSMIADKPPAGPEMPQLQPDDPIAPTSPELID